MSPTNSLSFEGLNNDVDFDDPLAPDIDATIGQISWIRTSNSVEFTLMGGYNQTERTLGREDVDGSIYNLNVVWQARPATSITFLVAHDIRAQPEALSTGTTEFGDRLTGTTSDSNELFTNDRQEISIEQQLGRNTITLGLFNNEEDYEDVLQDNENRGVRLQLDRELSPRSRLAFALESRKHDFTDEGEEIEEIRASLLVEWDLSRRLGMAIGATYQDRESDAEVGFRPSYDEWAGTISFVYDLFD